MKAVRKSIVPVCPFCKLTVKTLNVASRDGVLVFFCTECNCVLGMALEKGGEGKLFAK